jgi:hypothetical protein
MISITWQGGLTSPSLEKRCPDVFTEKNINMYTSGDLSKFTFFLWKQMTGSMKSEFYQQTVEHFMPHMLNTAHVLPTAEIPMYTQSEIEGGIYWYNLDQNKEQVYKCGRGTAQKAIYIEFKSIQIPIPFT